MMLWQTLPSCLLFLTNRKEGRKSLIYLKVCVTRLVRYFKELKPKRLCMKRVFTVQNLHHNYGTMTVSFVGTSPNGYRVGDVHADFDGRAIKQALKRPSTLRAAYAAYERTSEEIRQCGIDLLQCVIPEDALTDSLEALLNQACFVYCHTVGTNKVYRRWL